MFHTIIIAGNVGRDPEMRYTPSGIPVTSFSVASSRQYNNSQGQMTKETIWFKITCWSKLAEFANSYVKKGSKVLIEGRLVPDPNGNGGPRVWTRNDGTASASFEINASALRLLSSRGENENSSASGGGMAYQDYGEQMQVDEDEIPF